MLEFISTILGAGSLLSLKRCFNNHAIARGKSAHLHPRCPAESLRNRYLVDLSCSRRRSHNKKPEWEICAGWSHKGSQGILMVVVIA